MAHAHGARTLPPASAAASDRCFFALPPVGAEPEPPRRIWELEPWTLLLALGVLLGRGELETVFLEVQAEARGTCREDVLLHDAVQLCSVRCAFAEAVERLLDARTKSVRQRVGGAPMAELAAFWLGLRDEAEGQQLAALLWSLARDRRWVVRPLFDIVHGDIWVRALRLLGARRAAR